MAILFESGFEELPFTGAVKIPPWTSVAGAPIVQGAIKNQGDYAGQFDRIAPEVAGSESARKQLATTYSELYLRAYVRVNAVTTYNRGYIFMLDDYGNYNVLVGANSSRNVVLRYTSGGALLEDTSATQYTLDFWHCLELYALISDTVGVYRVYFDDVELADVAKTGIDNRLLTDIEYIGVGLGYAFVGAKVYIDCVVCADERIHCKVPFGGGLNPAQMAEVILGL